MKATAAEDLSNHAKYQQGVASRATPTPRIVPLQRRDAKVPAAKRILTALCHYDRGSAVTQTTNFRD
jgi:hypothetical protein